MSIFIVGVDYDEDGIESYRGITITHNFTEERFDSGDPSQDWISLLEYVRDNGINSELIYTSSSLDHFIMDTGYAINDEGFLVKERVGILHLDMDGRGKYKAITIICAGKTENVFNSGDLIKDWEEALDTALSEYEVVVADNNVETFINWNYLDYYFDDEGYIRNVEP